MGNVSIKTFGQKEPSGYVKRLAGTDAKCGHKLATRKDICDKNFGKLGKT